MAGRSDLILRDDLGAMTWRDSSGIELALFYYGRGGVGKNRQWKRDGRAEERNIRALFWNETSVVVHGSGTDLFICSQTRFLLLSLPTTTATITITLFHLGTPFGSIWRPLAVFRIGWAFGGMLGFRSHALGALTWIGYPSSMRHETPITSSPSSTKPLYRIGSAPLVPRYTLMSHDTVK